MLCLRNSDKGTLLSAPWTASCVLLSERSNSPPIETHDYNPTSFHSSPRPPHLLLICIVILETYNQWWRSWIQNKTYISYSTTSCEV